MRITLGEIAEIVAEEVREHLQRLHEKDGGKRRGKAPQKPETADAEDSPSPRPGKNGRPDPVGQPDPADPDAGDDIDGPAVDGDSPDPEAEQEPNERPESDDDAAIDGDGDGGEEPSGAINEATSGKTVQAVSIEPKSQVLPGAKEIVITFNETSDSLRIQITETGLVKFFWGVPPRNGELHDLP